MIYDHDFSCLNNLTITIIRLHEKSGALSFPQPTQLILPLKSLFNIYFPRYHHCDAFGSGLCKFSPGLWWEAAPLKRGRWFEHVLHQRRQTMTNEHMRGCSTSLVFQKMNMKTLTRCRFTPPIKMKNTDSTKRGPGRGAPGTPTRSGESVGCYDRFAGLSAGSSQRGT